MSQHEGSQIWGGGKVGQCMVEKPGNKDRNMRHGSFTRNVDPGEEIHREGSKKQASRTPRTCLWPGRLGLAGGSNHGGRACFNNEKGGGTTGESQH